MKSITRTLVKRYYHERPEAEQVMILCCLFSFLLIFFRIVYTGSGLFLFLVWNLFLAFLPYALSRRLVMQKAPIAKPAFVVLLFLWLLFIPNAFYIITDLFHLGLGAAVPLWYDLILLLSFAWSGLLFGVVSVRQMEKLIEKHFHHKPGFFFLMPVMFLNGLGVYIGRYLRFNSWDIITSPFQLFSDMLYLFLHPVQNRFDWSMIACYTILMTLIYLTIKKLGRSL